MEGLTRVWALRALLLVVLCSTLGEWKRCLYPFCIPLSFFTFLVKCGDTI